MAAADYASVAQQLYVAYFGRPADPTGLANVEAALAAAGAPTTAAGLSAAYSTNAGVKSLIDSFGSSAESAALYTGTTTQFVNAIYHDLFNRGADVAGLNFWVTAIDNGTLTMAHAAQSILAGASTSDAAIVTAKVTAAGNFTTALNTGDALAAYSGDTAAAAARALLSTVTATTDQTAFEANITTTINTIVQGPSTTTALTTGIDTLVGGAGNDIFTGVVTGATPSVDTWNSLDSVDGGAGVNTLKLTDTTSTLDLSIGTIKNIQILDLTSTGALKGAAANVAGITSLTNANFVLKAGAIQTITANDNTAVSVVDSTAGTTVNGGSTVTVTGSAAELTALTALSTAVGAATTTVAETALTAAAVTAGTITAGQKTTIDTAFANGGTPSGVAGSTAVGVVVSGFDVVISGEALTTASVTGGANVQIDDQTNATLTAVTLSGTAGTTTITSDSLATLSLVSNTSDTVVANTTAKSSLTINANASSGKVTDAVATTVALNVTGAKASTASSITLVAVAATEVDVATAAKTTLILDGSDTAVASVVVTGAGSFTTNVSTLTALAKIDASGLTGASNVTLNATTTAFAGGAGNDTVHISNATAPTTAQTIDGGAGTNAIGFLFGAALTTADGADFTNFQVLDATGGTGTYNAGAIAGITSLQVGSTAGAVTFSAVAAGTDLTLLAPSTNSVTYTLGADTATDALTLHLGTTSTSGLDFSAETVNIGAIESVTIDSKGTINATTGISDGVNLLNLTDTAATSLTVTGTESLTITGLTTLKTIDTTALTAADTVVIHSETVSTGGVTVTDGDANLDFIGTAAAGKVDTIVAGNGHNTIVESGAGNSSITVGTGVNTITVGTGQNTITAAAHTGIDTFNLGTVASANAYSSINGALHGDVINLGGNGVFAGGNSVAAAQITLNSATAAFADYVQAASAVATVDGTGVISWFNFGGNTYIVEDNHAAAGFAAGDNIVQLIGVINLAATGSVAHATAGHVTL
jgi:hypothetical protein